MLFCRLLKCYKVDTFLLSISFGPTEDGIKMRTLFARGMAELDMEQRFGRAPPSHQERELQKYA